MKRQGNRFDRRQQVRRRRTEKSHFHRFFSRQSLWSDKNRPEIRLTSKCSSARRTVEATEPTRWNSMNTKTTIEFDCITVYRNSICILTSVRDHRCRRSPRRACCSSIEFCLSKSTALSARIHASDTYRRNENWRRVYYIRIRRFPRRHCTVGCRTRPMPNSCWRIDRNRENPLQRTAMN